MKEETALLLAEIAASNEPLPARAQAVLASSERAVPSTERGSHRPNRTSGAAPPSHASRSMAGRLRLLSSDPTPPTDQARSGLEALTPLLADSVDPMRSLLAMAQLIEHAIAGVILIGDSEIGPLPGFVDDALLAPDAPLLGAARQAVLDGRQQTAFLWPGGAERAFRGFVRVTVLTGPDALSAGFIAIVLLSPAGPLHGLTARELQVLGLIIEGSANSDIALALVIAPRTVAAHLEHILAKLEASSRTLAAVRADRMGLYVPPLPRDA
jgi:DNA-binding CsgD family transcriptional regulator